ncbi:adenylate/guanylate cyclase domain-containing protein [Nocardioides nanhaiensis]|uniref:Guanylate cyclase domain-containing protein n=1 Tax=Nocardioides nanhaiensis TaxID=1476871 RepID=A0ABP8W2F4_9ACTN
MVLALSLLCGALVVAVAVLTALLVRTQRRLEASKQATLALERDLAAALRPPAPVSPADRLVRRVVRTVDKVRSHGVSGLLQASLEDLSAWAATERSDILNIAAADGTVTLFFSDIEDSTAINAKLGDAAWVRVLAGHDAVVRGRVEQYRGRVVKTAGDGFMVAFRDAEAACRAALKIQKDLRRNRDPRLWLSPVRVRIGIHTGRVVTRDGDYFGSNVAMAARVASHARGGEVLASTAVRDALDDDAAVVLLEGDEVSLKGLPGTHRLWRVERRRPAAALGAPEEVVADGDPDARA